MIIRALLALVSTRYILHQVAAYDAAPRWGQASVLVNEALFIHGGKVDQFNQYSYTSAPNTNDVLYLSLSNTFVASSPPWQLVSSSTNSSTSQGPALAWHTLSAFNSTEVLLFGGLPDANSKTVTFTQPDSGGLLDVYSRIAPQWITEPSSWGGEPIRRIRHSTVTTSNGLVFIFGGSKADGSQTALSEHFYFDPSSLSFKPLPTTNAPPDMYGHVSVILPDGKILVFGGFSSSKGSLLPFSTIWVFDPTTNQWAVIITDTSSLPSPRLAFVAVCIQGGKIIIHGGSDAAFQNNFSDGWILDTTTNPWTWTKIDALTQLGARRDHFAVSSGDNVIFGFGYTNNGPAPAGVQVYNPSSGIWSPSYTPPTSPTYTHTLPQATQTRNPTSPTGDQPSNPTSGGHNGGSGNGSADDNDDDKKNRTTAIAVGTAFGILALVAVGLGAAFVVRRRRRAREGDRRFMMLADDDFDDGGNHEGAAQKSQHRVPAVRMHTEPVGQRQRGILGSLGFAGSLAGGTGLPSTPRRDMLADEDAQSFGEWYNNQRRQGTGGSSWSLRSILGRTRSRNASAVSYGTGLPTPWREKSDPFSDGASPMRDEEMGFVGAAAVGMGGIAAGHVKRPSNRREMSYQSYASSRSVGSYRDPFADPLYEEERQRDTFDPAALYRDHEDGEIEEHDLGHPMYDHGEGPAGPEHERPPLKAPVRLVGNLAPIQTVLPLSQGGHALSPLSEQSTPSQSTLHHFATSGSSQGHANSDNNVLSPFDSNSRRSIVSSLTSAEPTPPLPSPGSATTSIVGASAPSLLATNQPMRRSGSWWSRFARGGILDRRSSGPSRRMGYDIRDPNPPPTLGAIEERSVISTSADKSSPHGSSPGSAGNEKMLQLQRKVTGQSTPPSASKAAVQLQEPTSGKTPPSRAGSMKVYGTGHGKSMSSLRTADSEAIERMVEAMDVVQRVQTRSHRGSGSTSSAGGLSLESHAPASISEHGDFNDDEGSEEAHTRDDNLIMFMSPEEYTSRTSPPPPPLAGPSHPVSSSPPSASSSTASSRPPSDRADSSGNVVADRIKAYERRMSLEIPTSPSPVNTKQREERTGKKRVEVKYGLVPRQSLFIANPDKSRTGSGDS